MSPIKRDAGTVESDGEVSWIGNTGESQPVSYHQQADTAVILGGRSQQINQDCYHSKIESVYK